MANIFKRSKNALLALADRAYDAYRPVQQAKPVAKAVARGVGQRLAPVKDFVVSAAQDVPRSLAAVTATKTGKAFTPKSGFERAIYGNDVILPAQKSKLADFARTRGASDRTAGAIGLVGLGGTLASNFIPGGKGASKAGVKSLSLLQKLAKETNGAAISNLLRRDLPDFAKLPVRDRTAAIAAFRKVKTEQQAKDILDIITPPKRTVKVEPRPQITIPAPKAPKVRVLPENQQALGGLVDASNEQLLEMNRNLGKYIDQARVGGGLTKDNQIVSSVVPELEDDVRAIIDLMGVPMNSKRSLDDAAEEAIARIQQATKRRLSAPPGTSQAFGVAAGIDPETDEQGKMTGKVGFDPLRAALGVVGSTAVSKLGGKGKIPPNAKVLAANEAVMNTGKKLPGLKDITYSAGKQFPKLPVRDQVKAFISDVTSKYANRFSPVEDIVKQSGKKLKPSENPAVLFKRFLGGGGIAQAKVDYELSPILKQVEDLDGFRKFLIGSRMTELAQRGIGESGEQALRELASQSPVQFQKFQETASQLYEYQLKQLSELREVGVLSDESFQAITSANQKYVPFQRVMEGLEADGFLGGAKDLNVKGTPIKKIKGSDKDIIDPLESVIKNTYEITKTVEKNRALSALAQIGEFKPIAGANPLFEPKQPHITLYQNGKKVYLETTKELAEAIKGVNEEDLNLAIKALSLPARALRATATTLNVGFAVPNVLRDQLTAAVNSKYGGVPIYDFVSGLSSVLKKDDAFKEWLLSGADQATFLSQDRNLLQRSLQEVVTPQKAGFIKGAKTILNPIGLAEALADVSEKATRVGVFKRAQKGAAKRGLQGFDRSLDAMEQSREATVDFARRGSKMKAANAIIPFLNARLQGSAKFIQSARQRPVQTLAIGGAIASVPAAILYAHNRQYPEYDEIPDYIKDNNFIIMSGDEKVPFYKVPKGEVGQIFANPVENFLDFTYNKDRKGFASLAAQLIGGLSPIQSVGDAIPTAAKVPLELIANYDTFRKQNIVSPYQKDLPPELQFNNKTSETAKFIGGKVGQSPAKLEHGLLGLTSGIGKQALQLSDATFFGKLPETQNVPVLDRFLGEKKDLNKTATKIYEEEEKRKAEVARQNFAVKQRIEKALDTKDAQLLIEAQKGNPESFKRFLKDAIERRAAKELSPTERAIQSLPEKEQEKYRLENLSTTNLVEGAQASGNSEFDQILQELTGTSKSTSSDIKAKYQLEKQRAKESGEIEDYYKAAGKRITELGTIMRDKSKTETQRVNAEKEMEKISAEVRNVRDYGKFTSVTVKPKSGKKSGSGKAKKGKIVEVRSKLRTATPKISTIKSPTVRVVRAKSPDVKKLQVSKIKLTLPKIVKGKRGRKATKAIRVTR